MFSVCSVCRCVLMRMWMPVFKKKSKTNGVCLCVVYVGEDEDMGVC